MSEGDRLIALIAMVACLRLADTSVTACHSWNGPEHARTENIRAEYETNVLIEYGQQTKVNGRRIETLHFLCDMPLTENMSLIALIAITANI